MSQVDVDAWEAAARADPRLGPGTRRAVAELARHFRSSCARRRRRQLVGCLDTERVLRALRRTGWIAGDRLEPTMSESGARTLYGWLTRWRPSAPRETRTCTW